REWSNRIGLKRIPQGYFDYPAGSMFWARVEALAPLFKAGITLSDFPEEVGQTDGTLAHVIERFLVLSSLEQGFQPAIIKDKTNPSWSSWRLDQYINRSYELLVELLNKQTIKLIAFDIFDTLILRPLLNPETIKEIVARKAGNETGDLYRKFRVIAEDQARRIKGQDVNLDEIYSQFEKITNISVEVLSSLKQLEKNIEIALAQPRPDAIMLYREALKTRKPVVLISDMFLPRTVIETILKVCGIQDWYSIYISGELGIRKDNGDLYKYVMRHFNINPDEMLMIGDNEHSDVQVPCDMGANYIHLMRPVELAKGLPRWSQIINGFENIQSEEKIDAEIPLALVLNKNLSSLSFKNFDFESITTPDPYSIGYSLVGPLILSFVDWLLEQAKEDNIDHFYFLAREGRLIKSVYDQWCSERGDTPTSDYMVINRRSASVAAITSMEDILNIARVEY
ncbi:MAG: HAD family hydrolase, partial [Fervidobacterium sp.]